MDFRRGEIHTCMQWDIGEVREVEILFVYRETTENPSVDIIMYRYFGQSLKCWHYRVYRRFEVETQIRKANQTDK